jgi:type IV pilus assembly protein PilX
MSIHHMTPNSPWSRRTLRPAPRRGMALIFVLVMSGLIFSIAAISSRLGTQGERMARADRDRQVALQGAEAAFFDAEMDITDPRSGGRTCTLRNLGAETGCSNDADSRGLCTKDVADLNKPLYKTVNFNETDDNDRRYVKFGEFTGREADFLVASDGNPGVSDVAIPADLPKYIMEKVRMTTVLGRIESGPLKPINLPADVGAYRVTTVGYGYSKTTQVMLQGVIFAPTTSVKCTAS